MQESIFKFLESEKSLLWVKTYDYTEVENAISTGLERLENKKFFEYEAGKTVNKFTGETLATEDLFNTLDELYPQGIRKVPIFLLIKDSLEEILKKSNLDYIKEILDTKKANPKYNFTLIIADVEEVPTQIAEDTEFMDKEVEDNEENIKRYILNIVKSEKLELTDKEELENIIKDLKKSITKRTKPLEERESNIEGMVYVKGGKYKPSFCNEEKEVFDLEVGKYLVTQELYEDMAKIQELEWETIWLDPLPSYFHGEIGSRYTGNYKNYGENKKRPVECVNWWHALAFCNVLSIKYNLQPVYDLTKWQDGVVMINQLGGTKSYPDVADFKKTEGFRLPTEVEWEWFASGGEKGIKNDFKYPGSNNIDEVAWWKGNSNNETHEVGLKKPNELGLYDCTGNVAEWCYDTYQKKDGVVTEIGEGKLYTYVAYDKNTTGRRIRSGAYCWDEKYNEILDRGDQPFNKEGNSIGFRVVRTV